MAPLPLPAKVTGRHASLLAAGVGSAAKMLRVPETFDVNNKAEITTRLGVDRSGDYRVAAKVIQPGRPKVEAHVLGVAMREQIAHGMVGLLPKVGSPAPRAIELSELGVINAFSNDPVVAMESRAIGLIYFDYDYSIIALFNGGLISQLRTLRLGASAILKKIQDVLSCDEETATGVLMDGAFDITSLIEQDAREVCGQYVICRDYMERSENCHVEALFVSGPIAITKPILASGHIPEEQKDWNPLERFENVTDELIAPELLTAPWRWAAAIGGCIGLLEEE